MTENKTTKTETYKCTTSTTVTTSLQVTTSQLIYL